MVKTKSHGENNVILPCNVTNLATLGITFDDGKQKPADFKLSDFCQGRELTCESSNYLLPTSTPNVGVEVWLKAWDVVDQEGD